MKRELLVTGSFFEDGHFDHCCFQSIGLHWDTSVLKPQPFWLWTNEMSCELPLQHSKIANMEGSSPKKAVESCSVVNPIAAFF